ncbi:MAG TPA: polyprenyl synthetase family protein [Candidatus Ratteibacteria bacterium]|nr:polyprenyl synthetase family protein [Candidatus Ratteibacteria bacterium]
MDKIKKLKKEIENSLDRYLPSEKTTPSILHKAMRYSIFSGGKRLRPIIILLVGEILNIDKRKLMPFACGVEFIHNFSLIHDDLPAMDNDDYRRGKLTCHKKFGEDIAILAGDSLIALGFQVIAETKISSLISYVAKAIGSEGMAGGQVLDIISKDKNVSDKFKRQRDEKKTGKLFEVCFLGPTFFKRVNDKEKKQLLKISKNFGIGFQIRDDIEDKEGDIKKLKSKLSFIHKQLKKDIELFGKKGTSLLSIIDELFRLD